MIKGSRFKIVKNLDPWRKLSIALWPNEANRSFKVSFDLAHAANFKKLTNSTWTQVLCYAFIQTLNESPEKHLFVHGYSLKTRANIDLFIRMSVKDQNDQDSLWAIYCRALQDLSYIDFVEKFNLLKQKYMHPDKRIPVLGKWINRIPVFILIFLIHTMDFLLRFGIPVPFIHRYAYPSISVSNLGSVDTPDTEMLKTPLCYPPLSIAIGQVVDNKVVMNITSDHRVMDGKDVGEFIKALQNKLNQLS